MRIDFDNYWTIYKCVFVFVAAVLVAAAVSAAVVVVVVATVAVGLVADAIAAVVALVANVSVLNESISFTVPKFIVMASRLVLLSASVAVSAIAVANNNNSDSSNSNSNSNIVTAAAIAATTNLLVRQYIGRNNPKNCNFAKLALISTTIILYITFTYLLFRDEKFNFLITMTFYPIFPLLNILDNENLSLFTLNRVARCLGQAFGDRVGRYFNKNCEDSVENYYYADNVKLKVVKSQ